MFKEIFEVFDKPYDYTTENGAFAFHADSGKITVTFEKHTMSTQKGDLKGIEISFYMDGKAVQTNRGDAFRIFATVIQIAKDYGVKKYDYIQFFSDSANDSRVKMYSTLSKKIQNGLKWKHQEKNTDFRGDYWFTIFKKKP